MIDLLGWLATSMVVASYFFPRQETLRRFQMLGAILWALYGVAIGSAPVVGANILVFCAAAWTSIRARQAAISAVRPVQPTEEAP